MSDIKELESHFVEGRFIEVSAKDLPLHCPTDEVALWSSHPRVFLDVAKTGQVACPYCGTQYKLKAGEHVKHH